MLELAMLYQRAMYNGVYRPSVAYAYLYVAIPKQTASAVDGKVGKTLIGYKVQGKAIKCARRYVVLSALD